MNLVDHLNNWFKWLDDDMNTKSHLLWTISKYTVLIWFFSSIFFFLPIYQCKRKTPYSIKPYRYRIKVVDIISVEWTRRKKNVWNDWYLSIWGFFLLLNVSVLLFVLVTLNAFKIVSKNCWVHRSKHGLDDAMAWWSFLRFICRLAANLIGFTIQTYFLFHSKLIAFNNWFLFFFIFVFFFELYSLWIRLVIAI